MTFTITIVGRPNVGKSTLFNKLCGRRLAITDDQAGVTRDAKIHDIRFGDINAKLIDTAGLSHEMGELSELMVKHALDVAVKSDLILFMVDAKIGIVPDDRDFANKIRKLGKKVMLLANKAEGKKLADHNEFYRLGFGEPIYISAEHNLGFADLHDIIVKESKANSKPASLEEQQDTVAETKSLKVAMIGRPNVGKSTLFNAILGFERSIVSSVSGTTRDAINHMVEVDGRLIEFIDTAGMRKRRNIDSKLESLAVGESITALRRAHVVLLVIDATQPLERQDLTILGVAVKEGKGIILVANKIDLIKDRNAYEKTLRESIEDNLYELEGLPVVHISAKLKKNIKAIFNRMSLVEENWNKEVSTAKLNRWLKGAIERHQPPLTKNNRRLKLKYIVQTATRPPTFTIFCNMPGTLPDSYSRYLYHELNKIFGFSGVPIRLKYRKSDNPYEDES